MGAADFLYAFLCVFSEDEVNFVCVFRGFAESLLWRCRVFSFEIACASQKFRVSPFTFAYGPRKSHVMYVNLFICVWFSAYAVHWVAGSS